MIDIAKDFRDRIKAKLDRHTRTTQLIENCITEKVNSLRVSPYNIVARVEASQSYPWTVEIARVRITISREEVMDEIKKGGRNLEEHSDENPQLIEMAVENVILRKFEL